MPTFIFCIVTLHGSRKNTVLALWEGSLENWNNSVSDPDDHGILGSGSV